MRILFIGNSFTYYNNLPHILKQLALTVGKEIQTEMCAGSDKTLSDHIYDSDVLLKIKSNKWDYVILKEHSLYVLEEKDKLENSLRLLSSKIKEADATPLIFATWAREHLQETAEEISQTYSNLSKKLEIEIAPISTVWQKVLEQDSSIKLYNKDRSHPTILGSYLTALTLYDTLFNDLNTLPTRYEVMEDVMITIDETKARLFKNTIRKVVEGVIHV